MPDNGLIYKNADGSHDLYIFECKANSAGFTDVQNTELINPMNSNPEAYITKRIYKNGKGEQIINKMYGLNNTYNYIDVRIKKAQYYKATASVSDPPARNVTCFDVKPL